MRHFVFLLLLITLPGLSADTEVQPLVCPKSWINGIKYEGSCYGYFMEHLTFLEADAKCRLYSSARLASIHSKEEACAIADYVAAIGENRDTWIGLVDLQKDRRWKWSDGSNLTYMAWDNPMQPDNFRANEYCGQLLFQHGFLKWNDISCATKSPYLCKWTPKSNPISAYIHHKCS